jgi:hypothetical protein
MFGLLVARALDTPPPLKPSQQVTGINSLPPPSRLANVAALPAQPHRSCSSRPIGTLKGLCHAVSRAESDITLAIALASETAPWRASAMATIGVRALRGRELLSVSGANIGV